MFENKWCQCFIAHQTVKKAERTATHSRVWMLSILVSFDLIRFCWFDGSTERFSISWLVRFGYKLHLLLKSKSDRTQITLKTIPNRLFQDFFPGNYDFIAMVFFLLPFRKSRVSRNIVIGSIKQSICQSLAAINESKPQLTARNCAQEYHLNGSICIRIHKIQCSSKLLGFADTHCIQLLWIVYCLEPMPWNQWKKSRPITNCEMRLNKEGG